MFLYDRSIDLKMSNTFELEYGGVFEDYDHRLQIQGRPLVRDVMMVHDGSELSDE